MLTKINKTVKNVDDHRNISDMKAFFLQVWNKKQKHECENCGKWLGNEPLSYMFDHLLEKSKYPELKYTEENIMLVCLECHDNKTRGFLTDLVKEKIKIVKEKFGK
jgi:5-methylcytosine-specific restriction endonuclease McrA